jgi:cell wall-associated NlpC family hydrolase
MGSSRLAPWLCLLGTLLLGGCQGSLPASFPVESAPQEEVALALAIPEVAFPVVPTPAPASPGERAAQRAASLAGTRYRWGGTSPAEGFDCSGLVYFSYRDAAGVFVPRDTHSLRSASLRIGRDELRTGDLVFFRLRGPYGHVGIYAGEGRFIHAPSRGKTVRLERLDSPYWRSLYAESRRLQI